MGRWSELKDVLTFQEVVGMMEGEATVMSGAVELLEVVLVGTSSLIMPKLKSLIHCRTAVPRGSSWSAE